MIISLEQGADSHMAQLMPLPLTVSCFSKIQIGFTFLVPAHTGSTGQRAVKRVLLFGQDDPVPPPTSSRSSRISAIPMTRPDWRWGHMPPSSPPRGYATADGDVVM